VKIRIASQKFLVTAAALMLIVGASTQGLRAAEVQKSKSPSGSNVQLPNAFRVFSACPPALCVGYWSGDNSPASGNTDFTPAGIPEQFSFTTDNPVNWFCDYYYEHCHADYAGGTFTATGPAGTFTGVITSGFADQAPLSWEVSVTFSGQWSNGQRMTGSANERYVEEFQIPDTTLTFTPMH
jgi:hypothetical protein